jgi:hypothetical protein
MIGEGISQITARDVDALMRIFACSRMSAAWT